MRSVGVVFLLLALLSASRSVAQVVARGGMVPENTALRYGLKRVWIGQGQLDRTRETLDNVVLSGDGLFLFTSAGILQALDAETGATRWLGQFGHPTHPGTGPGVGAQYVAVTKGTALFVVDRATGHPVMERSLRQVSLAAPAVLGNHVYVSILNGAISTYDVSKPRSAPWFFRGSGQIEEPPLATAKTLAWASNSGVLYASNPNELGVRFQFQTRAEVVAPLGYQSPLIFVASRDGFVYGINEINGRMVWRFSAGSPVAQPPVAIRDSLYLVPEDGGLFCLSPRTGIQRWYAPNARQFLAASPQRKLPPAEDGRPPQPGLARVYAADQNGDTLILDARTGARLATMSTASLPLKLTNSQNDRLYMATRMGMLQCFHEVGLDQPTSYKPPEPLATPEKEPSAEAATSEEPTAEPAEDTSEPPAEMPAEDVFEEDPAAKPEN